MSKDKLKNTLTVGFYNVENLFDTIKDSGKDDGDFTPSGKFKWNKSKYRQKIKKITSVLSMIGEHESYHAPAMIGLVEVENSKVLSDLITHKNLIRHNYRFIHYESPDERGIDVALLYNPKLFTVLSSESVYVGISDEDGSVDYTRDILVVKGVLHGDLVYVIVNHWPSRAEGQEKSEYKRVNAAKVVSETIERIRAEERHEPKFIVMGDFNDNPTSSSLKEYLVDDTFYNPMEALHKENNGTLTYYGKWHLFDQIILSNNFFDDSSSLRFIEAKIFKKPWMRVYKGKLKGSPFRTFIGPWYEGGFSDHFPVYIKLKKKKASY
ncbi:Endonuclease/Exonuclease/phosphatase family protein [Tenacibaculum sp. MAR_2009_124]|uniref:endonuclease/exonuclease/phosphatase family protein n=1 Tax=Tenacibaculum sp. MAR_2009_124 TaxID=1250059 RepID=UPI000897391A|nr:endonuclease/exonuclease/phosphatase family protein [Tenacibaculum sp. MAR_2009_124]SEC33021.1 Endonuclease/Exonuclease/phosphatase family protein [Tenacibaculum sp. MAR_2009_124]